MRPKSNRCFTLRRHAVALAALSLFLGASGQALAGPPYYDYSGSVYTSPINLFPINVNTALLDLSGNTLDVGGGAAGSFSALAGAHLIADTLRFGLALGNGSGSISGAGTVATLLGRGSLEVGSWGTGSLTVSAGAVVDATTNPSACSTSPDGCYSFIGNAAGSTASFTVTGAGSQLKTLGNFIVGSANVYTPASSGFAFGTPGGVTQASVNVLDGGSMHTQSVIVSTGPAGPGPTGSEHTSATVTIDGSGSQWIVTPNSSRGGQATFNASLRANAQSAITVSNGGLLQLDGSAGGVGSSLWLGSGGVSTLTVESGGTITVGGATGSNGSFVGIGSGPTGSATVTVAGAGSQFNLTGTHAGMSVGAGSGGFGRLDITNGGAVTVGNFSIGSRSTGVVNVSGGTLQMNGTDGRLLLGDWGTGTLNISGGGIVDATLAPANCVGNWCGNFVGNLAGSTATLTIDGAGSELRLLRGASIANVYVNGGGGTVGGTSTATIAVTNGGSLRSSNVTTGDGINWTGFAGDGSEQSVAHITIDGAGSQWIAQPNALDGGGVGFNLSSSANALSVMTLSNGGTLKIDSSATGSGANLTVGNNGGTATMSVRSGAQVAVGGATGSNGSDFGIGVGQGSVGVVTLAGAGSAIGITGAHANTAVGSGGGTGQFKVVGGATLATGGLTVGTWHGTGVMNVDGSSVQIDGSDGRLLVGDWGTGSLAIRNGGTIDATLVPANCGNGNWCGNVIGNRAGSIGSLTIDGAGSRLNVLRNLDVASVWVDAYGGTAGGLSTGTIAISNGGALYSNGVNVGAGAGGSNFTGNGKEASIAHITIDGSGSKWIATSNTLDSQGVWFNLANFALAQSFMTLSNGALLKVDSSANNLGSNLTVGNGGQAVLSVLSGAQVEVGGAAGNNGSSLNIGWGAGSSGSVAVSGAGSAIALSGTHANMNLGWGKGASGQLAVTNGGTVTVGGLTIGQDQGGTGFVNVNGGTLQMNGTDVRLNVGSSSTGTLNVSGGGIVDATLNPQACVGNWCYNLIGASAGATGTLTISGAGSEVRTLGLAAGQPYVDSYAGVPGATVTANINLLSGGSLRTGDVSLARSPFGSNALGTEHSIVSVLIDGAGSQWIVTPNSIDSGSTAFMVLANANGNADVTVSRGGLLRIDGTAGSAGPNDFIQIGQSGKGSLTVTGGGSRLEMAGVNPAINVGRSGSAVGSFSVLSGATASTLYLNLGRDGATGHLMIDGSGSQLTQSGVGTSASPGTASASIGRDGGSGDVTVSGGGRWLLTDGGMDNSSGSSGSPAVQIGRGANSTGSLTIAGAGSKVEIVSTSLGLAPGTPDNFNPFVGVGYDNPATATGSLMVSGGGRLILTGDAVSTPSNPRVTQLAIGGRSGQAGTGTATVTGAGSEIVVHGYDALVFVGRTAGGSGVLNVLGGAQVSSISLVAGEATTGTVNVDNATIALSGHRTDGTHVGAGLTIGRGNGGNGSLNLTHGSALTITPSVIAGGMSIGGDGFVAVGTGTVNLDGGSSIAFGGNVAGNVLTVGRSGNGTLTLAGASVVDVGALGETRLGGQVGGVANLIVTGGSQFLTGIIAIGGHDESVAGGTATASFSGAGTTLHAYGATGLIGAGFGGNGNLSLTNQATLKGTLLAAGIGATGNGTITLNNATVDLSGQANDPSIAVAGAGLYVGGIGGVGTANIAGGSKVTITNSGNLGANVALGGFALPDTGMGSGTLDVSGGSQVKLIANPGLGVARIGHDGTGTATFSNASLLDVSGGDVIIAGQPGSTGTLTLDSASVVNASYVGVGANHGTTGGNGTLKINEGGTVNTTTLEIGPHGVLTGDGGIINAAGDVIVNGMILPGDAPGRITINCNLIANQGSSLVIGIQATPAGYLVGELVFGSDAKLNLANLDIHFNFIGSTDPNAFVATGRFNLDSFIETQSAGGTIAGLSTTFAPGESWSTVLANSKLSASADAYDIVSQPVLGPSGVLNVVAVPVPEPETWALWLGGIALMAAWMRRQRAARGAG